MIRAGRPHPAPPAPVRARRALITGATAGIGAEFARQLAGTGSDLVLVARDSDRLRASAAELTRAHGVDVETLAADLSTPEGRASVAARLAREDDPVGMLVNNAGSGLLEEFDRTVLDDQLAQLDLLVTAPMQLMHAALPGMLARGTGAVVNVSSIAALSPRDTYGASKAWLLSFGRWAHVNYRQRGVTVTTVVPGFVRTEFHARMGARTDTVPRLLWLRPRMVVRAALRAARRGRAVVVPSLRYRIVAAILRVLPAGLAAAGSLHPDTPVPRPR